MSLSVVQSEETTATMEVIEMIADLEDADIFDLPPLGENLDSDSLNLLCESNRDVTVQFEYYGYDVTITGRDVTAEPING